MPEEHEIVCKCGSGLKITAYSSEGVIYFKVFCKNCGFFAEGENFPNLVNTVDNSLEDIL